MKVIIAGSRGINDYAELLAAIAAANMSISCVISGTAKGVDRLGERYARENNIPVLRYVPDWTRYGKSAGIIRNEEMIAIADGLIALWDGNSKGTKHAIDTAKKRDIPVHVRICVP